VTGQHAAPKKEELNMLEQLGTHLMAFPRLYDLGLDLWDDS